MDSLPYDNNSAPASPPQLWGYNTDPLWSTFVEGEVIADAPSYNLEGRGGFIWYGSTNMVSYFSINPFKETVVFVLLGQKCNILWIQAVIALKIPVLQVMLFKKYDKYKCYKNIFQLSRQVIAFNALVFALSIGHSAQKPNFTAKQCFGMHERWLGCKKSGRGNTGVGKQESRIRSKFLLELGTKFALVHFWSCSKW